MKVKEFIDIIDNNDIYSLYDVCDYIEDQIKVGEIKRVATGLELDKHRWYSTAVDVYQCEDGYVGVEGAYQSFSEYDTWKDLGIICEAAEYKPVETITYVMK